MTMTKTGPSPASCSPRAVNPWTWQDAFGYVQANEISSPQRVLVCSGQLATDADGHLLHSGDMQHQIGQSLDNLETVLLTGRPEPWQRGAAQLLHHRRGRIHGCDGGLRRALGSSELPARMHTAGGRTPALP